MGITQQSPGHNEMKIGPSLEIKTILQETEQFGFVHNLNVILCFKATQGNVVKQI